MKRVRYFRQPDGSFKSKPLQSMRELVNVRTDGLKWVITGELSNVIYSGTAKNKTRLRSDVKKHLKLLGVLFLDEIRNQKRFYDDSI